MTSSVIPFLFLCVAFLSYIGTKAYYVGTPQMQIFGRNLRVIQNLKVVSTGKVQRYTGEWVGRSIKSGLLMSERDFFFFLLVDSWKARLDYM